MTGPFRTSVGHAFGRTAMPLAAYYGVTLALPLANGAGRSGTAFVQHAVIVLAVPPMLVLLICAIHAMVQAAARFARSLPFIARCLFNITGAGCASRSRLCCSSSSKGG